MEEKNSTIDKKALQLLLEFIKFVLSFLLLLVFWKKIDNVVFLMIMHLVILIYNVKKVVLFHNLGKEIYAIYKLYDLFNLILYSKSACQILIYSRLTFLVYL